MPGATKLQQLVLGRADAAPADCFALPRYLLGMVFQGVWWAGFLLMPFVLAKSFGASSLLITASALVETSCMFLALYWGYFLGRVDRRPWLLLAAIGGRLIMVLTPLAQSPLAFGGLMVTSYFFAALVYPAQNAVFQACFAEETRGRVFGWGALVQHLTTVVTSIVAGSFMDTGPDAFRLVFVVIGVCGFFYPLILTRLSCCDVTAEPTPGRWIAGAVTPRRMLSGLSKPFLEMAGTFSRDRDFLWFEINFMLYGIAYLMLVPIVPIFFTERLDLSYSEMSNARVLISSLGVALLGPLMGRIMDRDHPVRLCRLAFALVALYPLGLVFAEGLPVAKPVYLVYAAFVLYAIGMSGVNVAWNVGSISFAPPGRGGYYQGLHVTLVGLRGLIGPPLGWVVLNASGYRAVFITAIGFFLAAAASSALLWRRRQASEKHDGPAAETTGPRS